MFTTPNSVVFQLAYFQHGDLLDHTSMHCPIFFTAAIKMSRHSFKPVVADHSFKPARHFRLGLELTTIHYLIPSKPFPPLRLLALKSTRLLATFLLASTKQQLSFLDLTHLCAIKTPWSL